jgi:putative flippase GtrA
MATLNKRMRSIAIRQAEWIEQGIKFLLVGLMNTSIDLGLYYLLTRYIAAFAEASVLAKGVSYAAGVINSYLWNRSWTFRSEDRSWRTFAPFALTNLIGMAINSGALWFGMQSLSLSETGGLLLATALAFVWNFSISKFLVFKR